MKTKLKKALALCAALTLLLSTASCASKPTAEPAGAPTETAAAETGTSAATIAAEPVTQPEVDVSAYPVGLLGQNVKEVQAQHPFGNNIFFDHCEECAFDDWYPGVSYLYSSFDRDENDLRTPTDDAVFETLYTSSDTELYPGLKTGSGYQDYARAFSLSDCDYNREFCAYTATCRFPVNGKTATAYLFFFHADSVCHSIIITVLDKLDFKTLDVEENDRENYPVLFVGRSALEMKQKYKEAYCDISEYDTKLRKHMYLGVEPEEGYEEKPIDPDALIKGLFLFSDEYEALPGIRIGDSAAAAGFEGEEDEMTGETVYPCDVILVGGFFLEPYITGRDGNFASFQFNCKQLY